MGIKNNDVKSVMDKYDMLFLGGKFNCIYSIELLHSLKKVFQFEISKDELNNLIPVACKSLNMKFDPMIALNNLDSSNRSVDSYAITLW
ncbi:TPA: hypothetical protein ACXDAZ_003498 [Clostridium botulinum]|uniref:hypothetical protein n=2 Tax=Clostridium botulinum TaxID=1491 RepID=UPI0007749A67|nr:hypothetical protein [Clostridium botulinum]APC82097.1 pikk family atypical protein kinase [Clostridium botulinum]AUN10394.1 hypothetical protein RSJ6_07710 [Clostridium botulinum]MCS4446230.1 hypothetical protein [Clostridium botulinum]MCS4456614.1 hypothetical protein [Clostridium botulinum]MCS4513270.1 hypothetical protein [Clostridium botulinum]